MSWRTAAGVCRSTCEALEGLWRAVVMLSARWQWGNGARQQGSGGWVKAKCVAWLYDTAVGRRGCHIPVQREKPNFSKQGPLSKGDGMSQDTAAVEAPLGVIWPGWE